MTADAFSRLVWVAIAIMTFCTIGYVIIVWRAAFGI
jgi:hypothetical protein